jgi:hypothetical protein
MKHPDGRFYPIKKAEVALGDVYAMRVSGTWSQVRVESVNPYGGWFCMNLRTNRRIHVRSAVRFKVLVSRAGGETC